MAGTGHAGRAACPIPIRYPPRNGTNRRRVRSFFT
jgi:hypothetical protein